MGQGHGRYGHSAITARRPGRWPGGAGLAVYVALNVEHYRFGEGLVEDLVPGMSQPDMLNSSWREYGLRVGAWRVLDLLAELGAPATILLNSAVCTEAPDLVAAMRGAGHEIAAHGRTNSESQSALPENEECALIDTVTATIAAAAGERPQGWLSPWLAESPRTPDLLREAGYAYLLDFCADDQPIWVHTRAGPILSVPYSQEINDSAAIIGRYVAAADFADMIVDQVDEMLRQAGDGGPPLAFGLALHANIIGQPFRMKHLRRALAHVASLRDRLWLTRADAIAAHVRANPDLAP
jgi:hypothetical protein